MIRIAVGLRLGLALYRPHAFSDCGADVNDDVMHDLSCLYSRSHHFRHFALNDIVKRSPAATKIPCHLEPSGLYRSDGMRPNGASVVPCQRRKILVSNTFATFHAVLGASALALQSGFDRVRTTHHTYH